MIMEPINKQVSDVSFLTFYDRLPNVFDSEIRRIQTHLKFVKTYVGKNSASDKNAQILTLLNNYIKRGIFPQNYETLNRNPIFIDIHQTPCAVAYLLQKTGETKLAEEINKSSHLSYIKDIKNEELELWVEKHGLTLEHLAMIQPAYAPYHKWYVASWFIFGLYNFIFAIINLSLEIDNEIFLSAAIFHIIGSLITPWWIMKLNKRWDVSLEEFDYSPHIHFYGAGLQLLFEMIFIGFYLNLVVTDDPKELDHLKVGAFLCCVLTLLSTIVLTIPCFGCSMEILSESLVSLDPHMVLKEKYGASTIAHTIGSLANTGGQSTLSQGVTYRTTEQRRNSRNDHHSNLWKKISKSDEESETYQSEVSHIPII